MGTAQRSGVAGRGSLAPGSRRHAPGHGHNGPTSRRPSLAASAARRRSRASAAAGSSWAVTTRSMARVDR